MTPRRGGVIYCSAVVACYTSAQACKPALCRDERVGYMGDEPQGQPESQDAAVQVIDLTHLAARQAKQVIIFTGDVLTTTSALLISALSLVAALAWNSFMLIWLPTVTFPNLKNPVTKQLVYALAVTLITVLTAALLSRVRKRVRGRNMLTP